MKHSTQQILEYTNERLKKWYENVKIDNDIDGYGLAFHNSIENGIIIFYKENGIEKAYSIYHFEEQDLDFVFNVWMEQAE